MSAISRARERAARLREGADRLEQRRRERHGRASDGLTTITVDETGQLVSLEFTAEVTEAGPNRWASSVLTTHRLACETVRPDPTPPPIPTTASPRPSGPTTPGKPLAPEQDWTLRRTERMVEHFAQFSATQPERRIIARAGEVELTFDGALGLLEARTTFSGTAAGPAALAAAVEQAWRDAAAQLRHAVDPEAS